MTKESFFLRSSFYRSIFVFIPMGFLMVFYGIKELKETINDFPKVEGVITSAKLYWEKSPYSIELFDNQWYDIYEKKYFRVLKEKAVKGKKAEIRFDAGDNSVEQLIVDGEILFPYCKCKTFWIVFIGIGCAIITGNFTCIVKFAKHGEGKR
ncbi:MAG: hypothetical protein ACEPOZ_11495 [Marinifilaceae bacterium]